MAENGTVKDSVACATCKKETSRGAALTHESAGGPLFFCSEYCIDSMSQRAPG